MMNWVMALLFVSALVGVVVAEEVKEGVITSKECYYCGKGNLTDIVKLCDIYGNSELKLESLAEPFRTFDDACGTNVNKTLKTIKCPFGCMIAQHVNSGSIISGCARDGMKVYELSSRTFNDQQFQMAVCSNDECNESYQSAKDNRVKPVAVIANSTVEPVLEVNGTLTINGTEINDTGDKKVTPKPKQKPNSAASTGASICALVLGLLAYSYAY